MWLSALVCLYIFFLSTICLEVEKQLTGNTEKSNIYVCDHMSAVATGI